jgi:hypothetical protein
VGATVDVGVGTGVGAGVAVGVGVGSGGVAVGATVGVGVGFGLGLASTAVGLRKTVNARKRATEAARTRNTPADDQVGPQSRQISISPGGETPSSPS